MSKEELFPIALKRLEEYAQMLKNNSLVYSYELKDYKDGIVLTLILPNKKEIKLRISSSAEMFWRIFDNTYTSSPKIVYDLEDQVKEVENLIDDANIFIIQKDYYEEIYKKNNKVILKRIIFASGAIESKSFVFAGRLRSRFGANKIIARPN